MPRDITKVIDVMVAVIPETETALLAALAVCRTTACYTAPENFGMVWQRTRDALMDHVGKPTCEWEIRVAAIFSGTDPG